MCYVCYVCYVLSRFIYLPIHSNALKSISLKRLTGSTCLTGFNWFEVFGVFKEVDWFKGSYNPLSKNHNSFSCPYRLLDYMNRVKQNRIKTF